MIVLLCVVIEEELSSCSVRVEPIKRREVSPHSEKTVLCDAVQQTCRCRRLVWRELIPEMLELFLVWRCEFSSKDVQVTFVYSTAARRAWMGPLALDLCPLSLGSVVCEEVAVHVHFVSRLVPQLTPEQNDLVLVLHTSYQPSIGERILVAGLSNRPG